MASQQLLQLFKATYDGDLPALKSLCDEGLDLRSSSFVIETDEVCLCGAAFENLGLEFTTITSPSKDQHLHRNRCYKVNCCNEKVVNEVNDDKATEKSTDEVITEVIDQDVIGQKENAEVTAGNLEKGEKEAISNGNSNGDKVLHKTNEVPYNDTGQVTPTPDTPVLTVTGAGDMERNESRMTSSLMSTSFLSTGRRVYEPPLAHWLKQGRCSHINDQSDLDYDYLEDLEDMQEGDDLARDLDLEVYGIRLSPHPMAEDAMSASVSASISASISASMHSLQMTDSMEACQVSPVNSDDMPSAASSGPNLQVNSDLLSYLNRHYNEEELLQTPITECTFPCMHDSDSLDSDGSGVLVGSIKLASITPLHVASARGHDDIVTFLLDSGCEVNAVTSDTEETPLHLACRWGRCSVVKTLLDRNADPVRTSAVECSPMHIAIELSCSECLSVMLDKLPEASELDPRVQETLLVYSLTRDNVQLTRYLLDKFKTNINEGLLVESGQTFLHKAAGAGAVQCVQLLAEHGADLVVTNSEDETALHLAASCGHVDTVRALLQAGAVPTSSTNWMIGDNQTPLMLAAYNNYPDVIDALLPYDDINCQSECGDTALHYCAFRGCLQGVQGLIAAGCLLNLHNQYAATALWNAVCYADIVTTLIKAGATTKVKSVGHDLDHLRGAVYDCPRTPLEIALEEGFLETAVVLLRAGCSLPRIRGLQLLDEARKRYDLDRNEDLYESVRRSVCSITPLKVLARCRILRCLEKHDENNRNKLISQLPVIDDSHKAYLSFDDL